MENKGNSFTKSYICWFKGVIHKKLKLAKSKDEFADSLWEEVHKKSGGQWMVGIYPKGFGGCYLLPYRECIRVKFCHEGRTYEVFTAQVL